MAAITLLSRLRELAAAQLESAKQADALTVYGTGNGIAARRHAKAQAYSLTADLLEQQIEVARKRADQLTQSVVGLGAIVFRWDAQTILNEFGEVPPRCIKCNKFESLHHGAPAFCSLPERYTPPSTYVKLEEQKDGASVWGTRREAEIRDTSRTLDTNQAAKYADAQLDALRQRDVSTDFDPRDLRDSGKH